METTEHENNAKNTTNLTRQLYKETSKHEAIKSNVTHTPLHLTDIKSNVIAQRPPFPQSRSPEFPGSRVPDVKQQSRVVP